MRAVAAERSWDGKYQLLDNIKNNPDGLTLYLCLGQAIFPAATCLSISPTKWTRARPAFETKAANDVVRDYVVPF